MRSKPLRAILALLFLAGIAASAEAAVLELYVSPAGNDEWNGRRADRIPGSTDGPFATLERARFRLQKGSPAWKLGFEQIPVERIGLRRKP